MGKTPLFQHLSTEKLVTDIGTEMVLKFAQTPKELQKNMLPPFGWGSFSVKHIHSPASGDCLGPLAELWRSILIIYMTFCSYLCSKHILAMLIFIGFPNSASCWTLDTKQNDSGDIPAWSLFHACYNLAFEYLFSNSINTLMVIFTWYRSDPRII